MWAKIVDSKIEEILAEPTPIKSKLANGEEIVHSSAIFTLWSEEDLAKLGIYKIEDAFDLQHESSEFFETTSEYVFKNKKVKKVRTKKLREDMDVKTLKLHKLEKLFNHKIASGYTWQSDIFLIEPSFMVNHLVKYQSTFDERISSKWSEKDGLINSDLEIVPLSIDDTRTVVLILGRYYERLLLAKKEHERTINSLAGDNIVNYDLKQNWPNDGINQDADEQIGLEDLI